ncbi:hypothetical protein pdam_00012236 [Pocillopora damicornis]|uniref:Uncharacterized protein n=1 Tax=Pocillopora damicornis TaxID=46731 RepID=A0A3M6UHI6_POCDA|nr:hypothetical protein pdam_00012236 [Pocillopora damicornis]
MSWLPTSFKQTDYISYNTSAKNLVSRSSNNSAAIPGRIVTDSRSGLSGIAGDGGAGAGRRGCAGRPALSLELIRFRCSISGCSAKEFEHPLSQLPQDSVTDLGVVLLSTLSSTALRPSVRVESRVGSTLSGMPQRAQEATSSGDSFTDSLSPVLKIVLTTSCNNWHHLVQIGRKCPPTSPDEMETLLLKLCLESVRYN